MKSQSISPFVVGPVITPLLRPLPVLFAYAHALSKDPGMTDRNSSSKDEFHSHLNCFMAMVETAASAAELPDKEIHEVIQLAKSLAQAKPQTLVSKIDKLDLELAHLSEVHKSTLRQAYNMKPELFKTVFQQNVRTRKLLLAYQSKSTEGVPKLEETLSERCYYEVKVVEETYVKASLKKADFVVFAPTQDPISSHVVSSIQEKGVPFLVLVNLGANIQRADMVQTRLAGLYQKNGIPILHRPFPAIRLFQKIDRMIFENTLKEEPAPVEVAEKSEAKAEVLS